MKLTSKGQKTLMQNNQLRNKIAIELNCSENSVRRWVKKNENNSDLTKINVIKIIVEYTKLAQSILFKS